MLVGFESAFDGFVFTGGRAIGSGRDFKGIFGGGIEGLGFLVLQLRQFPDIPVLVFLLDSSMRAH